MNVDKENQILPKTVMYCQRINKLIMNQLLNSKLGIDIIRIIVMTLFIVWYMWNKMVVRMIER